MAIKQSYLTRHHENFILARRWLCVLAQIFIKLGICSGMGLIRLGAKGLGHKVWQVNKIGYRLAKQAVLSDRGLDAAIIGFLCGLNEKAIAVYPKRADD